MAEGPQALKKDPPFGVAAPEGGSFLLVRTMNILLSLHFYYTLSRLKVKQGAESLQRSPGCGSQRLIRCRSHPAGRGPSFASLFPPLAAVGSAP